MVVYRLALGLNQAAGLVAFFRNPNLGKLKRTVSSGGGSSEVRPGRPGTEPAQARSRAKVEVKDPHCWKRHQLGNAHFHCPPGSGSAAYHG